MYYITILHQNIGQPMQWNFDFITFCLKRSIDFIRFSEPISIRAEYFWAAWQHGNGKQIKWMLNVCELNLSPRYSELAIEIRMSIFFWKSNKKECCWRLFDWIPSNCLLHCYSIVIINFVLVSINCMIQCVRRTDTALLNFIHQYNIRFDIHYSYKASSLIDFLWTFWVCELSENWWREKPLKNHIIILRLF